MTHENGENFHSIIVMDLCPDETCAHARHSFSNKADCFVPIDNDHKYLAASTQSCLMTVQVE